MSRTKKAVAPLGGCHGQEVVAVDEHSAGGNHSDDRAAGTPGDNIGGATTGEIEMLDRLKEFLHERSRWLLVALVPGIQHPNDGWDIVLRLDGTYFDREMAEGVLDSFAKELGIDTPPIGELLEES